MTMQEASHGERTDLCLLPDDHPVSIILSFAEKSGLWHLATRFGGFVHGDWILARAVR